MRFVEQIIVSILRPIYRIFFERPLWWFLAKLKSFFLNEVSGQLGGIEHRLQAAETEQRQNWQTIQSQLQRIEANNAAQWDALEQLLLAVLRQPEALEAEAGGSSHEEAPISSTNDLSRVHAASSLR